jgi:hypothetical protein
LNVNNAKAPVRFIEPMLLRQMPQLPGGGAWPYKLKLDGFRAVDRDTEG